MGKKKTWKVPLGSQVTIGRQVCIFDQAPEGYCAKPTPAVRAMCGEWYPLNGEGLMREIEVILERIPPSPPSCTADQGDPCVHCVREYRADLVQYKASQRQANIAEQVLAESLVED